MSSVRIGLARAVAVAVTGVVGLLAASIPSAQAHAQLIGSTPEDGSTVEALPAEVVLEFNEEVGTPAFVEVTASDGTELADGEPEVLAGTVTQPLGGGGPSGTYTLAYRVVSADGHSISGELSFDVTTGPPPGASGSADEPAESDDSDDGFFARHVEHFALAAVGIVAGAWLVRAGWRGRT